MKSSTYVLIFLLSSWLAFFCRFVSSVCGERAGSRGGELAGAFIRNSLCLCLHSHLHRSFCVSYESVSSLLKDVSTKLQLLLSILSASLHLL